MELMFFFVEIRLFALNALTEINSIVYTFTLFSLPISLRDNVITIMGSIPCFHQQ